MAFRVRLGNQGRFVIPAEVRSQLGLTAGDILAVKVEGEQMILETPAAIIRRLQKVVAEHIAPGRSLADELIAERREEARRENAE